MERKKSNDENTKRLVLKSALNPEEYRAVETLRILCEEADGIGLKLELEYKYAGGQTPSDEAPEGEVNEFLYYEEDRLVGYAGICGFGGPLEIAGMVHPDLRRSGIFSCINAAVRTECRRRGASEPLLLCDRNAVDGQGYLAHRGAVLASSEYSMVLEEPGNLPAPDRTEGLVLKKAEDKDASEILRQNRIYFDADADVPEMRPSDEEARGMRIYLAEVQGVPVGKIHLQQGPSGGGIYGLGVLPEHRGRGLGREILLQGAWMLAEAGQTPIILQVATENRTALNLYQSCGFRLVSVMDYFTAGKKELLP